MPETSLLFIWHLSRMSGRLCESHGALDHAFKLVETG